MKKSRKVSFMARMRAVAKEATKLRNQSTKMVQKAEAYANKRN